MTELLAAEPRAPFAAEPTRVRMVSVSDLTKRFPVRKSWGELLRNPLHTDHVTVLNSVSFEIREGEFFGLLGPNGAGKTTLFRVLSTLVLPDSGTATVGGFSVEREGAQVRSLLAPVIANERSLYWRLSAQENLRLFAVLQRIPRKSVNAEVARALGVVGLHDAGGKMVGTFSSGMKQRLLIARALLGRPRVLLLDEPTRSLDPISARDFRAFLRDTIVGEQGCTVLLATHDADDVWNLCDRVGVLNRGEMLTVESTPVLRLRAGDDLHRVWLRDDDAIQAAELLRRAGHEVADVLASPDPGWSEVTVRLAGGSGAASVALRALVESGVTIARFERKSAGLAELIERVIHMERKSA